MRKTLAYFSILSLINPSMLFAEKAKSDNIVQIENKSDPGERLKPLIESDPEIKVRYNSCKAKHTTKIDEIPDCLWNEVKGNQQLKDKVLKFFEAEKQSQKPEDKVMVKDNSVKVDQGNDPYLKKLDEVIAKNFDEIFKTKGDGTKDQIARSTYLQTDHKKFAELYNTHLSSSITQAISSYCLEADGSYNIKDKKEAQINRNNNLAKLKGIDFSAQIDCKNKTPQTEAACHFQGCLPEISKKCYGGTAGDNTTTRACAVMDYIKNARAGIQTITKQLAKYDDLAKGGSIDVELKGMKKFDDEGDVKRGAQDITTITSADVLKADEESKKEIESLDCIKDNQISNIETCKKLISQDKEKAEAALAEFGMRRIAQVEKIKEDLKGKSNDEIIKFLQSEGDSKENAEKYLASFQKPEDAIAAITKKYEAENEAIIKSYKEKFENNLIEEKDIKSSITKLTQIQAELQAKGKSYAEMLHYSNVVSAFLTIQDSKGNNSKMNTAVISRELASAKNINGKSNASTDLAKNLEAIQKNFKASGAKDSGKSDQTTLSVEQINDVILNKDDGLLDKPAKP